MKKVAVLTFNIDWVFEGGAKNGGASVVSKNLILELAKNPDIELSVLCIMEPIMTLENVNIIHIKNGDNLFELYKNIEEAAKNNNYDVIITTNLEHLNCNPILQSQTFIHRCNTEAFPVNLVKRFFSKKKIKKQNSQFKNLPKENKYFAVSKSIKDDYVKNYGLNPDNVYVCHLGCERIYDEMPEITKKDFITFGCIANNSINKGGHLFLFGLLALKLSGFKGFKAKIISKSFKKSKLLKIILKVAGLSKIVEFLEPTDNIIEYYKSLDCLVLPSKNEAFGLVALETMSCGKPCIVSSTTGAAEIIKHNENGLIFNRHLFVDFVKQLKTMYKIYNSEKYDNLAKNAYETSKEYTWKNFVDSILNCF